MSTLRMMHFIKKNIRDLDPSTKNLTTKTIGLQLTKKIKKKDQQLVLIRLEITKQICKSFSMMKDQK